MLRFQLFGVPFEIGLYFWVGSALLGGGLATGPNSVALLLIWVACVFVSIVVHEMGHALVARKFGVQPAVELHAIGGVTRLFGPALTRRQSLWVTFCGPAAGFGLYLAAFAVDRWFYPEATDRQLYLRAVTPELVAGGVVHFLLLINFWWTAFNLLPILPLDGGQLLRSALGPRRLKATEAVGVFVAGSLAAYFALHGRWWNAVFLGYLAFVNFQGNPRAIPGGIRQSTGPGR